jgi:hypothetical protein
MTKTKTEAVHEFVLVLYSAGHNQKKWGKGQGAQQKKIQGDFAGRGG